uniref:Colmedin n=1 Tax=Hirondellea gigas TaxID=1518452 RepID=A0A6A7FZ98_9CRUS
MTIYQKVSDEQKTVHVENNHSNDSEKIMRKEQQEYFMAESERINSENSQIYSDKPTVKPKLNYKYDYEKGNSFCAELRKDDVKHVSDVSKMNRKRQVFRREGHSTTTINSSTPGQQMVSAQRRALCGMFAPCLAFLALLVLLQAAAFMFLHHQLNQTEKQYYNQLEVLHHHFSKMMEEFRKLKTESAYLKSLDEMRIMYQGHSIHGVTNDDVDDYNDEFYSGDSDYTININNKFSEDETIKLQPLPDRYYKAWDKYYPKDNEQQTSTDEFSGDGGQWSDNEDFESKTHNFIRKTDKIYLKSKLKSNIFSSASLPMSINDVKRNATEDRSVNEVFLTTNSLTDDPPNDEISKPHHHISARYRRSLSRRSYRDPILRDQRDDYASRFRIPSNNYYGYEGAAYWPNRDYGRNSYSQGVGRSGRGVSREYETGTNGRHYLTAAGAEYNYQPAREYNAPLSNTYNPTPVREYHAATGRDYSRVAATNYNAAAGQDYTSSLGRDFSNTRSVVKGYNVGAARNSYNSIQGRIHNHRRQDLSNVNINSPVNPILNRNLDTVLRSGAVEQDGPLRAAASGSHRNSLLRVPPIASPILKENKSPSLNVAQGVSVGSSSSGDDFTLKAQNDQETRDENVRRDVEATNDNDIETDKSWLQLTSYAKIPHDAIEQFCSRARSSCPPGPVGPAGTNGTDGLEGPTGETGTEGVKGATGPEGPQGFTGLPGSTGRIGRKGERGRTGMTGLDGRDGLMGEPGLDGIPGRNGLNGVPGVNGISGFDGLPGHDGRNGADGTLGPQGFKGGHGIKGIRGIPGPQGRTGKSGKSGTPGIPGISTWLVNGSAPRDLLIPPAIPGGTTHRPPGPLVVMEGDNVRLRCAATGYPTPLISWTRGDSATIPTGSWKDASVTDQILNLTHVRRDHTGSYYCEAYNGVPPNAFKNFSLEVHFEPYLKVKEWKVGAFNGSSARLECRVESYPVALTYWENRGGTLLENSDKHTVYNKPNINFVWRSTLVLLITNITSSDFGHYYCIARNELAITRGSIEVHEIDPRRYKPSTGATSGLSFGPDPPDYSKLFGDLCPKPIVCETCAPPPPPTHGSGFLYCLNIGQLGNYTYPGYNNRTLDCKLSTIGKPVLNRNTNNDYGSWLRDPLARNRFYALKYYTTKPEQPMLLFEYTSKELYRKDTPTKNHTLPYAFVGNSHVIYNGSFYYQQINSSNIVRYNLLTNTVSTRRLPLLSSQGSNYLYTDGRDYLDLSVEENGLWAIYGLASTNNNTVVAKLDSDSLTIEYSWNISLSHHKFGEMFITCGVLYGIDSATERETKIRFALDLYTTQVLDVDLHFTNPFRKTTTLSYNHKEKEIYSWDSGNQLNYPVVYIDIGYNTGDDDQRGVLSIPDYQYDFQIERNELSRARYGGQDGDGAVLSNDVYIPGSS